MTAARGPAPSPGGFKSILGVTMAALVAFVLLCGLGVWQVLRLAQKERLLAEIDTRVHAAPRPVPAEAEWPALFPDAFEYRRVSVAGTFDPADRALVFRPQGNGRAATDGPGYLVFMPLRLPSGAAVLVDRGFVASENLDKIDTPKGPVTVTGLMRSAESRNWFTPADDPEHRRWFTRDPQSIARQFGVERAAPFTIDADDDPSVKWPVGGQTLIDIPNNHLSYAVTWFGLALTLVGVWVAFIRTMRRPPKVAPSGEPATPR